MQNIIVPEFLSVFDPKINKSTSTTIHEEEIDIKDSVSQFGNEEEDLLDSKTGRWDYDEQVLYLEFVEANKDHLESKECRRSAKIFKMMAGFIKTRGPDQCRSHHQKMHKKYNEVNNILINCKKGLPRLKKRKAATSEKKSLISQTQPNKDIYLKTDQILFSSTDLFQSQIIQQDNSFKLNDSINFSDFGFQAGFKNQPLNFETNLFDLDNDSYPLFF